MSHDWRFSIAIDKLGFNTADGCVSLQMAMCFIANGSKSCVLLQMAVNIFLIGFNIWYLKQKFMHF
jgi:hypothetical protein